MSRHNIKTELSKGPLETSGCALYVPNLGHLLGWGKTVPADASEGYAKGGLFIHTDLTGETDALYSNIGDKDSSNFNAVTVAAD